MIAFGVSIHEEDVYRDHAEPGIRRALEPDSEVLAFRSLDPIARAYNLILDAAAAREDLEALVLVDPYCEIADPAFCAKARAALADPGIGVAGALGGERADSMAWWDGPVVAAPVTHRYHEHLGGELPVLGWAPRSQPPPAEVGALDGRLLVLSPWVVRNIRFDEELVLSYGFDYDFGRTVRAAGRRLLVADLAVVYHDPLELVDNLTAWVEAHIAVSDKWERLEGEELGEEDWKRRARWSEARREAARTEAFSEVMRRDARFDELDRQIAELTDTLSWRLTEPLRVLNASRRERRDAATRGERDGSRPWRRSSGP